VAIPLLGLLGLLEQNQLAIEDVPSEMTSRAVGFDDQARRSAP
jgi:hypothetical protein